MTRVEQDREAATVAGLARRFTALVRGSGTSRKADPDAALADLEAWLADARTSGLRAVETFAAYEGQNPGHAYVIDLPR